MLHRQRVIPTRPDRKVDSCDLAASIDQKQFSTLRKSQDTASRAVAGQRYWLHSKLMNLKDCARLVMQPEQSHVAADGKV